MMHARHWLWAGLGLGFVIAAGAWIHAGAAAKAEDQANGGKGTETDDPLPVVLAAAQQRRFERVLEVQGNAAAKNLALVPSVVGGTVSAFYVEEGAKVVANETKLFKVDDLKLQKAVEIRGHEVAVARCALREKQAYRRRIEAEYEKAQADLARFESLHDEQAVSLDQLEMQQTRFRQAKAQMDHAASLVALADEQVRQAEAALAIAEKDLADAVTFAPISGTVSAQFYEFGEMAEAGKPVMRIDDGTRVEISAFLPAEHYAAISPGATLARITVYGQAAGLYPVSYKAPVIHPALRTFEVRWIIENPPEAVAPGALAEIAVVLEEREGLGVPADAVLLRRSGPVVFTVENATAHEHAVETGIESDGWVELMDPPFDAGAQVVSMGQSQLEEGAAVAVRSSDESESGV